MKTKKIFTRAAEILSEVKFIKNQGYRDFSPDNKLVGCCVVGAVYEALDEEKSYGIGTFNEARMKLRAALRKKKMNVDPEEWNDKSRTTKRQAVALLREIARTG